MHVLAALALVWTVHTDGAVRSSPAVTADRVYIGSEDGYLYAIARRSGRVRWKFAAGGPVNGSPAVAGDLVFVTSSGFLNAVDRNDGSLRWRIATGRDTTPRWGWEYFISSPVVDEKTIYAGGADGHLRAVTTDGRVSWTSPDLGGKVISSPRIAGDLVLVGSDAGRLFAFDKHTGTSRWTFETEGAHLDSEQFGFDRRSIHASPAIRGDEVIIGGRDGFLYGVGLLDGKERWRVDHKVNWVIATATIAGDDALVGNSDGHNFEAVDRSGHVRWSTPVANRIFSTAAIDGGVAYAGCHDGSLLAFDTATGAVSSRFWIGAEVTSSPAIRDGQLYVGADDGNVYALSIRADASIKGRAVYWQDGVAPWFADGARVRDAARQAGYTVVDGAALAAFMNDRISDRQPSVVIFAAPRVPVEAAGDPDPDSLLMRYLQSGGRVAWSSLPPYSVASKGLDFSRATKFLGVSFERSGHDDIIVRPTNAGRARNLSSWWIGSGGVPPEGVDAVLAADDYGRAVTWSKRIGSGEFLMLGGSRTAGISFVDLIRLAESSGQATYEQLLKKAGAARHDPPSFLAALQEMDALRPNHPTIMVNLVTAYAMNGRTDDAIAVAERLGRMKVFFDASRADFDPLRNDPRFVRIRESLAALQKERVSGGIVAFTIREKGLIPEGLAFDEDSGRFFVSSVRQGKILAIDRKNVVSDFAADGRHGLSGLGIDRRNRLLWACSTASPRNAAYAKDDPNDASVVAFDIATGKVVRRVQLPQADAFCDDLTVSSGGDVYVSDSTGAVLELEPGQNTLDTLVPRGVIRSPQGSALSADEKTLFVADYGGPIRRVDVQTGEVEPLQLPSDFEPMGIDGLTRDGQRLIAVQNGIEPNRIVELTLAGDGRSATACKILEMNDPLLDEPTIGKVVHSKYYFVGDSQGNKFDTGNPDQSRLSDVVVFAIPLH